MIRFTKFWWDISNVAHLKPVNTSHMSNDANSLSTAIDVTLLPTEKQNTFAQTEERSRSQIFMGLKKTMGH